MTTKDKKLAQQCYPMVEVLLMSHGDYELCRDYLGLTGEDLNAFAGPGRCANKWNGSRRTFGGKWTSAPVSGESNRGPTASASPTPMPTRITVPKMAEDNFVGEVRNVIEILVATKSNADAENFAMKRFCWSMTHG